MKLAEFDKEIRPLYETFNAKNNMPWHTTRCQEEWGYAFLMDYHHSGMHADFVNMTKRMATFYLDDIYAFALNNIKEASSGPQSNAEAAPIPMSPELYKEMEKHCMPGHLGASNQDELQNYILFTFALLISSTFSTDNGQTNEFTKYHKYLMLIFIGIESTFRDEIMAIQKKQKYKDEKRREEVEGRLTNLFEYCNKHALELVKEPFNQGNMWLISERFVLGAIKAYEGCL